MNKYEGEFPKKYFKEFLEYFDITKKHDEWRAKHLWKNIMIDGI